LDDEDDDNILASLAVPKRARFTTKNKTLLDFEIQQN